MEYLSEINDKEVTAFELLGITNNSSRLMCQCSVESNQGEIMISYVKSC